MLKIAGRIARLLLIFIVSYCMCIVAFHIGYKKGSTDTAKCEYTITSLPKKVVPDINDEKFINSIIYAESKGNPKAVSKHGCIGLMQINWKVWKKKLARIGITRREQLFDPATNKKAGKFILADYHKQTHGNIKATLVAYSGNAKFYVERVLFYYYDTIGEAH
jgi:hypothetical protein